ncbi:uncharacterized protein [Arachis hypogaea]|uniref:uncharacterized protein n=1 Tax=Arachis hypogaea TaxID=3818 RepID=UPI003B21BB63
MFLSTFKKTQLNDKVLQPSSEELVGFFEERVPVSGYVWVRTTLGEYPHSKTLDIQYLIVDCFSPYNIILGRPTLNAFGATVSTIHLCVKFCSQDGATITVHSNRKEARQCYNADLKMKQAPIPRINHEQRPIPVDDLNKVNISNNKIQNTNIGSALSASYTEQITDSLQANTDLFTWTPAHMPGIDPKVICHGLALDPKARSVRQKKRHIGQDKTDAAVKETQKLLSMGFIREIRFTSWLANEVMVKKNSGKW